MSCSSEKTFNEAIKALVFLNCHAGMGKLRLPNESNTAYFFVQLWTLVVFIVSSTSIYVTFTFMAQAPKFRDASPMAVTMYAVILYTNTCITVISPVLVWLQSKGLKNCLRKIPDLDYTFQTILGARNEYRKYCIRLTCHVIAVYLVMGIVCIYDAKWSLEYSGSLLTTCFITLTQHRPIGIMLIMDLNFITSVGYLENKFRNLNDALLKLAELPNSTPYPGERLFRGSRDARRTIRQREKIIDTKTDEMINEKNYLLQEIRKAHLELCKLSRQINSIFGIQNLLSSGISFAMITGLLYTIYSAFVWKRVVSNVLKETVASAIWVAIYTFKIWRINHSCWSVSDEAQKTGEVIYELLPLKVYKELKWDQIRVFALQIFENPVRLDACGFFPLNYECLQDMIGSITKYLIILVQISQLTERTT